MKLTIGKTYLINCESTKEELRWKGRAKLIRFDDPAFPEGTHEFLCEDNLNGYFTEKDILAEIPTAREECNKSLIGWDAQDIEASFGWLETAKSEGNTQAIKDLFDKIQLQVDALEEEYLSGEAV